MKTLSLNKLKDSLEISDIMPIVFIGHGTPMNAIQDNDFSRSWLELGRILPKPQAILVVSAHWMTNGSTLVDISAHPRTIHDFYGFPKELYSQNYPAKGEPKLAKEIVTLLASHHAEGDESWGLDHGAWSILKWLYPQADVPVFQLSIDMSKDLNWHLEIGKMLKDLRNRGVLILGSGNVVHNLKAMRGKDKPYDWAIEFDSFFANNLTNRDFDALADIEPIETLIHMAHPTMDHYIPSLTIAGASNDKDELHFMNEEIDLGSVSMRSFIFHSS